ncbi:MAG TPA: hypothetical protein VGA80_04545 [Flavobacteriaceae bacterium]
MSQIVPYIVQDPIVALKQTKEYFITKGARQTTHLPIPSISFSNSTIQFSAPPPSPDIIIDRIVQIGVPFEITFKSANPPGGTPLLRYGTHDSLRAFPLSQIFQTVAVTFNNNTVSLNYNDLYPELFRYQERKTFETSEWSKTVTYPDCFQRYEDGVGTSRNALSGYNDSSLTEVKRGCFFVNIIKNDSDEAIVSAYVQEPIFMSPFYFGCDRKPGFFGLQTWNFTFNLDSKLERLWSHINTAPDHVVTSTSVKIGGTVTGNVQESLPTLYFSYYTPFPESMPPPINVYDYFDINRYPTDNNVVQAPNTEFTISSQNIQFNSIPKRIYLYARRKNSERTMMTTDTTAVIRQCVLNWDNLSGQFSSASQRDLYDISINNGFNGSWEDWLGMAGDSRFGTVATAGSMLCLEFGNDIVLKDDQAPGMNGTFQLQVTLTFFNVNPDVAGVTYTLYIVPIFEGVFSIGRNMAERSIGVVTADEVRGSSSWPLKDYKQIKNIYGGNLFGNIASFLEKAEPYVTTGMMLGKQLLPLLSSGSGFQVTPQESRKRREHPFSSEEGGQLLSVDELRKNKKRYFDEEQELEE